MNDTAIYKTFEEQGRVTLQAISDANKFNKWMYESIKNYCEGNVLEIGSGIGNISKFFVVEGSRISLSDISEEYKIDLERTFPHHQVFDIDIADNQFDEKYSALFEKFDAVFALNVVEHIEDDRSAINNMIRFLKKGGTLVVLVPAYQVLYNRFDKELGHFRRYTKCSLSALLPKTAQLQKTWFFNLGGILGWFVWGNLLNRKTIGKSNMRLYNLLTPLFKWADRITFNRIGLSVIMVARKQ